MKISTQLTKLANFKKDLVLKDIIDKFSEKNSLVLIILFALPPATPLSFIPGFSVFFGVSIALVAAHLLSGRKKIWLPKKLSQHKIGHKKISEAINKALPYIRTAEKVLKKRWLFLTRGWVKKLIIGFIFIFSIFLMLPIPYVDFVFSSVIILLSLSLIARDGMVLIGVLCFSFFYLFLLLFVFRILIGFFIKLLL
ncbi:exopolysaccharide biosynthesis protein [Legionella cardiaca]|uniref:Exopolysaccharide biosynthesis protein n=1 Tax=Legionella cardiaca TaxID=1071983 RepID=A0ABY8APB3_9GAMM|nr:exopolysaccharide biosynthesis protein [Legionella cardiaca]WED42543.1 exopolysaccharide biosynthesis protein [Legionella cardiaca]